MNIYRTKFVARCPVNDQRVEYNLEIRSTFVVMVEDIQQWCEAALKVEKPYHENMADFLITELGGQQVLRAFHHGVEIETRRGEL